MKEAIILGFAMLTTLVVIFATLIETIYVCIERDKYDFIPSALWGLISVIFWCIFYYLTHQ